MVRQTFPLSTDRYTSYEVLVHDETIISVTVRKFPGSTICHNRAGHDVFIEDVPFRIGGNWRGMAPDNVLVRKLIDKMQAAIPVPAYSA